MRMGNKRKLLAGPNVSSVEVGDRWTRAPAMDGNHITERRGIPARGICL
jgi:hypothetical protein